MTESVTRLPFIVRVMYDGGREKTWTNVNFNLTDRWLYIFHSSGTQYMFDTKNMIQVTAYPTDNQ